MKGCTPMSPSRKRRGGRWTALPAMMAIALLGSAITACSSSADSETQSGVLHVGVEAEATTLDPHLGTSGRDYVTIGPIYDTLLSFDNETLETAPGLATEWEFTEEPSLELTIREGVKFHDGTDFDAEAVAFNLERARTHKASAVSPDLASIKSVEAVDATHVTVHLKSRDSALLGILADRAGMMISPTALEKEGEKAFGRNPVGTGPFVFDSWTSGDKVVVSKNSDYWIDGLPKLEGIELKIYPGKDSALTALATGKLDLVYAVAPDDIARLESEEGIDVTVGPSLTQFTWWWNMSQKPFDDVRVRRAFNLAVDREALLKSTYAGHGAIAYQPVPESLWAYDSSLEPDELLPYDLDEARRLLKEAGYGDGLEVRVTTTTDAPAVKRLELIQAQLAKVGIDLKIEPKELTQYVQEYFEDYSVSAASTQMSGRPDPTLTFTIMYSNIAYHNTGKYSPPGFEDLLKESRTGDTLEKRKEAFSEMTQLARQYALNLPLYFAEDVVVSRGIKGYEPNPVRNIFTTVEFK